MSLSPTHSLRTLYVFLAFAVAVPVQAQQIDAGDLTAASPTQPLLLDSTADVLTSTPADSTAYLRESAVPSVQEDESDTRFLRWLHQDATSLVGTSGLQALGYAAGTVAVLAPLSNWDDNISPVVKDQAGGPLGGFLEITNELGGPKAILLPAAAFAASLATDDTRFQNAAFTSLQSLLYAGAASYAVKYAVGRSRPHQLDGTHTFNPFSGNASFPSGHTTTAFAIVTPWVMFYPHPITYGLFALSTGTAVARIARDAHWATDVLAGAALGFTTGYWLSKRHGAFSDDFQVTPILAPNNVGLSLKATF